jgi:hypothetical protein
MLDLTSHSGLVVMTANPSFHHKSFPTLQNHSQPSSMHGVMKDISSQQLPILYIHALPSRASNKVVARGARVRNLTRTLSSSVENNTVCTGRSYKSLLKSSYSPRILWKTTSSISTASPQRELLIRASNKEVETLIVVVCMGVC